MNLSAKLLNQNLWGCGWVGGWLVVCAQTVDDSFISMLVPSPPAPAHTHKKASKLFPFPRKRNPVPGVATETISFFCLRHEAFTVRPAPAIRHRQSHSAKLLFVPQRNDGDKSPIGGSESCDATF